MIDENARKDQTKKKTKKKKKRRKLWHVGKLSILINFNIYFK